MKKGEGPQKPMAVQNVGVCTHACLCTGVEDKSAFTPKMSPVTPI